MKSKTHSKESKQPRILKLPERIEAQTAASFFAIANPGMEKLVRREIEEILHGRELVETVGGVQFQAQVQAVYLGQARLKTVNRLLLRIDQFGARDFQKLFRKVKGLPWQSWLQPGVGLRARASSHASRLKIKKGIERTILEAFAEVVKTPPKTELMILARVEDDICTLSLDLSGELLHKRGDREDVGAAPLRETWAAGILSRAWEIVSADQELREKFSRPWHWIEPMAGTAVFAREALKSLDEEILTSAPIRTFAMQECLVIEGLKSNEATQIESSEMRSIARTSNEASWSPPKCLKRISILDRDRKQLNIAETGIRGLRGVQQLRARGPESSLETEFLASDFKQIKLRLTQGEARFVILNPPWGVRLKSENAVSSFERQTRLLQDIDTIFQPTFVVVVLPQVQIPNEDGGGSKSLKTPLGWTAHEGFSFRAGGIPVQARFFSVGTVKSQ